MSFPVGGVQASWSYCIYSRYCIYRRCWNYWSVERGRVVASRAPSQSALLRQKSIMGPGRTCGRLDSDERLVPELPDPPDVLVRYERPLPERCVALRTRPGTCQYESGRARKWSLHVQSRVHPSPPLPYEEALEQRQKVELSGHLPALRAPTSGRSSESARVRVPAEVWVHTSHSATTHIHSTGPIAQTLGFQWL